jgi:transglutaminase-like putative cysteine protease
VAVTVKAVDFPAGAAFPPDLTGLDDPQALEPNSYVQSDDPLIREKARQAVGDAKTAAQACRNLETFVRNYISRKDLSVGYASATEVLDNRQGDCTEHAVLLAALCRSAGIPAKVVTGLAYTDDGGGNGRFVPHAWVAAWGGRWVPLDAAYGVDVTHLALSAGSGDRDDFFEIITNLGQFDVQDVQLEH